MSTEVKEPKTHGLSFYKFPGTISEIKDKETGKIIQKEVKYPYERACFTFSRAGKDVNDVEVEGNNPTIADCLAWIQASGFTVELDLDSKGNPKGPSAVEMLVAGINRHLAEVARAKALNTPDQAREKALQLYMKMTGQSRSDAHMELFGKAE